MTEEGDSVVSRNGLLQHLKIRRIVVVDDDLRPLDEDAFVLQAMRLPIHDLVGIQELSGLKHREDENLPGKETAIRELYRGLGSREKKKAVLAVLSRVGSLEDLVRTFKPDFGTVPPDIEYLEYCATEWDAKQEQFRSDETPTLFVFDLNQEDEGRSPEEGARQLAWVLANVKNSYCALVSKDFEAHPEANVAQIEEICTKYGIGVHDLIPISREQFKNPKEFARRIKWSLLRPLFHKFREECKTRIQASMQTSLDRLSSLEVSDFEQIVFTSSIEEGEWPPNTYFRAARVYFDHALLEYAKDPELRLIADQVQQLLPFVTLNSANDFRGVRQLRQEELYLDGTVLASINAPLELGDIFQDLGGNKEYILIAQPCDLQLRGDGKRGRVTYGDLLEIRENPSSPNTAAGEEPEQERPPEQVPRDFPLHAYSPQYQQRFVYLPALHPEPLSILDLCAFSHDGTASLRLTNSARSGLTPAWAERLKILKSELNSALESARAMSQALENGHATPKLQTEAKEMIILRTYGKSRFAATLDLANNGVTFQVKRVRRLRLDWAGVLLENSHRFRAREAFEHPFARGMPDPSRETET